MTGWEAFRSFACDEVLCLVLEYLHLGEVLDLVSVNSSAIRDVTCPVKAYRWNARAFEQSLLHRLVVHRLGGDALAEVAVDAALKAVRSHTSGSALGNGLLYLVRMLDKLMHWAEALDEFTSFQRLKFSAGTAVAKDTQAFHEALFGAETRHPPSVASDRQGSVLALAADAALTAMLLHDKDAASAMLRASAQALRDSEDNLDQQIQEGRISFPGWFERVARQRSAVEFLRRKLDGAGFVAAETVSVGFSDARRELDEALDALDDTIDGYMREGYDLSCPRLVGGVCGAYCKVPYSHWWVFFGGLSYNGLSTGRPLR
jgi:hypothetical protein